MLRDGSAKKLLSAVGTANTERAEKVNMPADLGIIGSTFRAYRGCLKSPSRVYKDWVISEGYDLILRYKLESRDDFLLVHSCLAKSLDEFWNKTGNRALSVSEKFKLVDLFLKAVAFKSGHPCESARDMLFEFANIPLDKFSLLALRKLFYGVVIARKPSMGDITDYKTYEYLQTLIHSSTSSLGIPNLVFDYYAWDTFH